MKTMNPTLESRTRIKTNRPLCYSLFVFGVIPSNDKCEEEPGDDVVEGSND